MSRKKTKAQQYSAEFEVLSTEIVEYIFKDSECKIEKTKQSKDGGYDIVVECYDSETIQKVYFECKLRSSNLNLRDISANMIIAYNQGAVALVILTNYDYTPQASENIKDFYQKTVLNIKVITGTEIQLIRKKKSLSVIPQLEEILKPRKNHKKQLYQFLHLDFENSPLHHQILKKADNPQNKECNSLLRAFPEAVNIIKDSLKKGHSVCVKGEEGVGKTPFINEVLNSFSEWRILHINAGLYPGQSQFLLNFLLTIWGIPISSIIEDFSIKDIDKIIGKINFTRDASASADILRRLFGDKKIKGIVDEKYNWLICNYILEQVKLHHSRVHFVLFIENIVYANQEIQVLISYLCLLFYDTKIPFIIEYNEFANSENSIDFAKHMKKYIFKTIELNRLSERFVNEFIKENLNKYLEPTAKKIFDLAGFNLLALNMIIDYANTRYDIHDISNPIIHELDAMDHKNIPDTVIRRLRLQREKNKKIFDYLYLLESRFPLELLEKMPDQIEAFDELIIRDFFRLEDCYIVPSSRVITIAVNALAAKGSLGLVNSASQLLSVLGKLSKEVCKAEKFKIYLFLKRYEEIIELLDAFIIDLKEEREYSSLLQYLEQAIVSLQEIPFYAETCVRFIIEALGIYLIRKEINLPRAKDLMNLLNNFINLENDIDKRNNLLAVHDYFFAKMLFKDCCFIEVKNLCEPYYERVNEVELRKNNSAITGKIGILYALSIKELYGDSSAKAIFERLFQFYPDELLVAKEYYSHLACMNFYSAPKDSLNYIKKILDLFEHHEQNVLPFHEYGDLAMCYLLIKDFNKAIISADDAIKINESNGVMAELGRANNIKSCALFCISEFTQAEKFAKEAFGILEEFKYPLYSWRSQLNYVQILVENGEMSRETEELLDDVYQKFKNICSLKISVVLETVNYMESREYHALVLLGKLFKSLGKDISNIIRDFNLSSIERSYHTHINETLDMKSEGELFKVSPYYHNGFIFVAG